MLPLGRRARTHALPSLAVVALGAAGLGCAHETVPEPREAAAAYAHAAARGDAVAIHGMLDERSRRAMSLDDVKRMVADQRAELGEQARAIGSASAETKARARVRWPDGEEAVLELREGRFLVSSADALPAGARTPAQALEQLRRVLARRSYAGLLRVLTPKTRGAIESDLRSLVEGLRSPEGLDIQQTGESATVQVPGGHVVRLRREGGTWHVEDFD
jgi:hypothetical protein